MEESHDERCEIISPNFQSHANNHDNVGDLIANSEIDDTDCCTVQRKESVKFSKRQLIIVALLSFANFSVSVCFALIVPFFPEEAARRGATGWMIGFNLASFQLAKILSSSFYGKYAHILGLKFMIITGNAVLAASTMLFGTLAYAPKGVPFNALCLVVRMFQGMAGAAVQTASFSIVAKQFPGKVTVVVGILEASGGLAYIIGPVLGGFLYQVGGFIVPFLVTGLFGFVIAILCGIFLISQPADIITVDRITYWKLLKIPQVRISIANIFAVALALSFFDLTMAQQMDLFGINAAQKGLMMYFISITYMVLAPIWGLLVDKTNGIRGVMTVGAMLNGVGFLLLGPLPLLPVNRSLWLMAVALVILGMGLGAQFIPPFTDVLHLAKSNGFPDDTNTFSLVSGLINSCYPLGAFIGLSVGGFVVMAIDIPWSYSGLIAMNIILCIVMILDNSIQFGCKQKRNLEDKSLIMLPNGFFTKLIKRLPNRQSI